MAAPNIARTISASEDFASTKEYADYLAGILATSLRELNWLLTGNLDVKNIKSKSIVTDLLSAGSVKTNILDAGAVTADKMTVSELSAITANMGTLTAGTIIGALIKTASSGQRVELSSTDNLLKAINNAGNYINILPNYAGSPALEFYNGLAQLLVFMSGNTVVFNSVGATDISISATSDLGLFCGTLGAVTTNSWSQFYSSADSESLQDVFDSIQESISDALVLISALSTSITSINSTISSINSSISDLESRVTALENP